MSESHRRQMQIFAQDPNKIMDEFNKEFERSFVDLLQRRFHTRRVLANDVYNEFIRERHHCHMNSTMWTTLGNFVMYLGKTGKCIVDEDERGWYVQWIQRDTDLMRRQAALRKPQAARIAMQQRHKFTACEFLLQNIAHHVVGFACMQDQWQAGLACCFDMGS